MKEIISEVINDFINKECMHSSNFYWGEGDLREIKNARKMLSSVYDRIIEHGLTKHVYVVEQLGDIIERIDRLTNS